MKETGSRYCGPRSQPNRGPTPRFSERDNRETRFSSGSYRRANRTNLSREIREKIKLPREIFRSSPIVGHAIYKENECF